MPGEWTLGVEEEFFLVDGHGRLVPRAPEALDDVADPEADVKPELLRYQVESATGVCDNGDDLLRELSELRTHLARGAALHDARLAASGTVVHAQDGDALIGPGTRYHRIAEHFGQLVVGGLVCGCHVHVGVDDRTVALQVSNHLRPWLPVLLALSANSPFVDGKDTGYASSRHLLYSRWPSGGPPPYLESLDQYESLVEGYLAAEAALDRKMVYWDVRPSEHQPTIEIRVGDVAATPEEATLFAIIVRGLVANAMELVADGVAAPNVPSELLRAGMWRAAKDGLAGDCPDPRTGKLRPVQAILDEEIARCTPYLKGTDELGFVTSTMDWVRERGGGAERQRRAFNQRGQLDDVLEEIVVRPPAAD
ncbi:MAG: glutamate--cysteine ligase [Kibdelosporangium sp.]